MKTILSKPELVMSLKEQLSLIEAYCKLYDDGMQYIVKDIATKIRILFHNTDNSKGLIKQLKLDHVNLFCSAEKYDAKSLNTFLGLTSLQHRVGKGWSISTDFDMKRLSPTNQQNWWNSKLIIKDANDNRFTRRKIILFASNKDGGAHVDPEIDNEYYDLIKGFTSGFILTSSDGYQLPMNPIPATIRKIAFEVLESFRNLNFFNESKLYFKFPTGKNMHI